MVQRKLQLAQLIGNPYHGISGGLPRLLHGVGELGQLGGVLRCGTRQIERGSHVGVVQARHQLDQLLGGAHRRLQLLRHLLHGAGYRPKNRLQDDGCVVAGRGSMIRNGLHDVPQGLVRVHGQAQDAVGGGFDRGLYLGGDVLTVELGHRLGDLGKALEQLLHLGGVHVLAALVQDAEGQAERALGVVVRAVLPVLQTLRAPRGGGAEGTVAGLLITHPLAEGESADNH